MSSLLVLQFGRSARTASRARFATRPPAPEIHAKTLRSAVARFARTPSRPQRCCSLQPFLREIRVKSTPLGIVALPEIVRFANPPGVARIVCFLKKIYSNRSSASVLGSAARFAHSLENFSHQRSARRRRSFRQAFDSGIRSNCSFLSRARHRCLIPRFLTKSARTRSARRRRSFRKAFDSGIRSNCSSVSRFGVVTSFPYSAIARRLRTC